MGIFNQGMKSSRLMWVIAGLVVASAGAWVHAQSTPTAETDTKIAIKSEPPADPLVEKGFRELYSFCQRSQPLTDGAIAQSQTTAIDPVAVPASDQTQPLSKTISSEASSAETPENITPVDICANFHVSFANSVTETAQSPDNKPEAHSLATTLERLSQRFLPTRTVASASPVIPPTPAAVEGLQIHQMAQLAKVPILMYHDILPKKEVFFDVTPEEFEAHLQYLQAEGMTPISPDWLIAHLKTGVPLPTKPVLLSFDDGYGGHYKYVFPLLQKYNYPALFSIYINKLDGKTARTSVTWEQLKEMAASPLVTIAAHSLSHPKDLRELSDDELAKEIFQSKLILEKNLGIPIYYFTYPEGKNDARVRQWAIAAGFKAAFSMNDSDEHYAGESPDLMAIGRFGQSRIKDVVPDAWGGYPAPVKADSFNFTTDVQKQDYTVDGVRFTIISGGRPGTIHADSRYQVPEILEGTGAIAGVDGGFFSLKYLDSNVMIGPVMSLSSGFVPGNASENPRLNNRPLVLISDRQVKFIPFDAAKHNTFAGVIAEAQPGEMVTDAFVGAAWLVRDGKPQPAVSFGTLFDFDARRHRAFWGINRAGQPVIGVAKDMIGSVALGQALFKLGFRDAIMVDSGASTSLAFQGESMVEYTPRPVPHVVALFPALKPSQPVLDKKQAMTP